MKIVFKYIFLADTYLGTGGKPNSVECISCYVNINGPTGPSNAESFIKNLLVGYDSVVP